MTVNPTGEQLLAFEQETPDQKPIVMLNLLRFRAVAEYGPSDRAQVSGRKAYSRYSKRVLPLVWEVGGQPLHMGSARHTLIGPTGELWDELLLVYYPSRAAFLRMIKSPAYAAIMHHRTAALLDSRLIETETVALPKWAMRAVRVLTRAKAIFAPKISR